MRLSKPQWLKARHDRETGMSYDDMAKKYKVSKAAIIKHAFKENWIRPDELTKAIKKRADEKVTGIVSPVTIAKRAQIIDSEAEKVAEVIKRHRTEVNGIRERLYSGLKLHKEANTLEQKKFAFCDIQAAKVASDALLNIHRIERQAWSIDEASMPENKSVITIQRSYGLQARN